MPLGGACDLYLDLAVLYARAEEEHRRRKWTFFSLRVFLWGVSIKGQKVSFGDSMWLFSSHFSNFRCFLPPWKENSQNSHR